MNRHDSVEATVLNAVAQSCYLEREDLRPELKLIDLGLDSLAITSVVAEIEAVCSHQLTPDEVISLLQANDLGELVERIQALVAPSTVA